MGRESDPTLIYIVSWTPVPPNISPYSYVVRMKESQAKKLEEMLDRHVEADHLIVGTVEEAGPLLDMQGIIAALKEEVPGTEKEWMP